MPATTDKPDSALARAADRAREALLDVAEPGDVGEHLGVLAEGDKVVSHLFACGRRGYHGWRWSVTIARASRFKAPTVNEIVLLPGDEAIVAPAWVPYKERLQPGDLSPGDLLPVEDDDVRLVPAYAVGDDPLDADDLAQVRDVARELYATRERTLSLEGREMAAQRWYDGDAGPDSPLARSAPDQCATCGFLVRLGGPLADTFGVCANGNANHDGRVVALGHGCGAHSEVKLARKQQPVPPPDHVLDTLGDDELERI